MATQNTDLKEAKKDAIMTPDMYRSMFLRQFTSQCSQSYDKMMAMGFMYTIQKPLRKIYPNDDDYYAALDRHTEFFNITPHVLPFVAGLLGMTVIGAMIAAQVSLSTALTFDVGGSEIVLQDLFDSIFPGLLPLLATFACVALYKKGVKTIWIIIGIFAICIIGTGLGVFAAA